MEKNTIKETTKALKRLIYKLNRGYCENLTASQLEKLEKGFENILEVEKELSYGLCINRNNGRRLSWRNFLYHVFPTKEERNKGKDG